MAKREILRVRGAVHDIDQVASLSDVANNMRLLSDKSLYILQNLSGEDVTFLSRYGHIIAGDYYEPVEPGSVEAGVVESAIDLVRRDLNDMGVETTLACICQQLKEVQVLVDQGATRGQTTESIPSNGVVSVGEGQEFETQGQYYDAKCNAANAIYDTVKGVTTWLKINNADVLAGGFGGITSGLVVGLAFAGPAGWAVGIASGLVTAIAGFITSYGISFADLESALVEEHTASVKALYNASNASIAEDNFIDAIENATTPITSVESGLLDLFLSSDLLNQLYDPRSDIAVYQSPSPVVCGAGATVWSYTASVEGWTFRDDSTANASAVGSWDDVADALSHLQVVVAGGTQRVSRAVDVSPALSVVVDATNAIQWDYDAVSDGVVVSRKITAIYGDATEYEKVLPAHTSAGTLILNLTAAGTLVSIELETSRSNGSGSQGWTFTTKTLEVRLV